MAGKVGHAAHSLIERMQKNPERFDFFQATRLMECAHPRCPPVGHSLRPDQDPLRYGQEPSLQFAPSTLHALITDEDDRDKPPRLMVHFLGLLGPNGPLPLHLTDYAHARILHEEDATFARFLDMFNHRTLSLFYDAWARNRQEVSYERSEKDSFAMYIGSFFGIGLDSLRHRDAVPDEAKLHYSGHLVCQTRHVEGLRSYLDEYFGIKVDIQEFMGQWVDLPANNLCHLGESPDTGTLGESIITGTRIWDCQQKFRIRMGPMHLADYERMLPRNPSFNRLRSWVENYISYTLSWDVQLVLYAADVPDIQLGIGGRLGWTTWLKSKPLTEDADDLILHPY